MYVHTYVHKNPHMQITNTTQQLQLQQYSTLKPSKISFHVNNDNQLNLVNTKGTISRQDEQN